MRTIGGLLSPHLDGNYNDIEQYITATHMDMDGTWATDVEMLAVSHLLNVPVFCFLKRIQSCTKTSSKQCGQNSARK